MPASAAARCSSSRMLSAETPTALVGEQEVGQLPGPRVAQRPARRPVLGDPVDDLDGLLVDRHHPLGEQLAQRHFQPGARAGDLVHAVQFEHGELADAHPGGAHQQQRVGAQPVRRVLQRRQQRPLLIRGQVAGQRVRQLRRVAGEDQPPGRGLGPAPLGDRIQERADGLDPLLGGGGGDRRPGAVVDRGGDLVQVRLDVLLPVQQRQRGQARVVPGQEPAEVRQLRRGALHRWTGPACHAAVPGRRSSACAPDQLPRPGDVPSSTGPAWTAWGQARRARRGGRPPRGTRRARRGSA